jgi:hypothetical protein
VHPKHESGEAEGTHRFDVGTIGRATTDKESKKVSLSNNLFETRQVCVSRHYLHGRELPVQRRSAKWAPQDARARLHVLFLR